MSNSTQNWVRVCPLQQVTEDKALGFSVNGQRLIMTRCGDEAYILQGFCSHMVFPLSNSKVDDQCVLLCALHHSSFNVRDGSVVEWSTFPPLVGSALALIRQRRALRTYPTRVTDGDVYVQWPTDDPNSVRVTL